MKLGFVSAIMEKASFHEVIDFASEQGFACVELACWPKQEADRRYAGVSHLDVDALDKQKIQEIKDYCAKKKVEISALAFYPNMMEEDLTKREENIRHLKKLIVAAKDLGIGLVNTFIGRIPQWTVEENLKLCEEIWNPIMKFAEENQVKIGIENCPMLFTEDEWPGGKNLASTPEIWREIFKRVPSPNLGLNFDPSHFIWQEMDYIEPLYEFKEKIFHVHFKDIKILHNRRKEVGVMALPLSYMLPKLPGLGDVNWNHFVSALTDIGYRGCACLEIEDRAFEDSREQIEKAILSAKKYMEVLIPA